MCDIPLFGRRKSVCVCVYVCVCVCVCVVCGGCISPNNPVLSQISRAQFLVRTLFLTCRQLPSCCVLTWGEGEREREDGREEVGEREEERERRREQERERQSRETETETEGERAGRVHLGVFLQGH